MNPNLNNGKNFTTLFRTLHMINMETFEMGLNMKTTQSLAIIVHKQMPHKLNIFYFVEIFQKQLVLLSKFSKKLITRIWNQTLD